MSKVLGRFKLAYLRVIPSWASEILPEHYQKRVHEFNTIKPDPVHWKPESGDYKWDAKLKRPVDVQNFPIHIKYPRESNKGLWGGEGFVEGYRTRGKYNVRVPMLWKPLITRRIFYSEILDKWMTIPVTLRTLDLIDEVCGFDHYILRTHEVNLNSQLGMDLKREMLLTLAQKTMHPNDAVTREKVYNRYKEHAIPEEEAEWVGLTVGQAIEKSKAIRQEQNPPIPLKDVFRLELIQQLQESAKEESSSSWSNFIKSPFIDTSEKKT